MERIQTGSPELDAVLGGFPAGKTILLTGDAGTGKTIFGLQFTNASCTQGLRTVYISTEESAGDLRAQGSSFGWNLKSLEEKGLLRFIELAEYRAKEVETALCINLDTIKGNFVELVDHLPEDTQVLVVDSLGSHTANLTVYEFRDRFDLLTYNLVQRGITALIILDNVTSKEFNDIALFSSHGAIRLLKRENPYTGRRERAMDIVKMRNTKTPIQLLSYEINPKGITVTSAISSSDTK